MESVYADYDTFEVICKTYLSHLTSEDLNKLFAQARIAFPYKVPVSDCDMDTYRKEFAYGSPLYAIERRHMKLMSDESINMKKFDLYCTLLGLNQTNFEKRINKDQAVSQEFYNLLDMRAKDLADGVLAVKYGKNKRAKMSVSPSIENMKLPI